MPTKDFNKVFSKRLKYYMDINNLTQKDLADKLDVGTASVSFWCNGVKSPRMDKVDKMCEIFHCNRSDLIEDKSATADTFAPLTLSEKNHMTTYRQLDEIDQAATNAYMEAKLESEKYMEQRDVTTA